MQFAPDARERVRRRRIQVLLAGFMVGLVLSGLTTFPLPSELALLSHWLGIPVGLPSHSLPGLAGWIASVRDAVAATDQRYPFLAYGTDWLGFAHLVIALLFLGPIKDPVRNLWVIQWGMAACVLVIPLALICGEIRGIPLGWRLIDCTFGVVGIVPLIVCARDVRELESLRTRGPANTPQ